MKWGVIFSGLFFFHFPSGAQRMDTLYYATGKITDKVTGKPLIAHIRYHSLPYGEMSGVLEGNSFKFALFDAERYKVVVSAPGFKEAGTILDPIKATLDRVVEWNVALQPSGDADQAEINSLQRLDNLIFETGTSKIDAASFTDLDQMAALLKVNPQMIIQLEGHTDTEGNEDKNLLLSENRVKAVKNYLLMKGAGKNQVRTKAFGGTQPLSRENTGEAHRLNRRVEMRVIRK